MNEFDLLINQYLNDLPEKIRKVLLSIKWQQTIGQISTKYSLTEEQKNSLIRELWMIFVGAEKPDDLPNNIKNEVGVSLILANQLSEEINKSIFNLLVKKVDEFDQQKNVNTVENKNNDFIHNSLDVPPNNLPTEDQMDENIEKIENNPVILDNEKNPKITINIDDESKNKPFDFNSKLNEVTKSSKETDIPNVSSHDPHREPIE